MHCMYDREDTPIETLAGYRAIMREVATLRAEVERLRRRVTWLTVALCITILVLWARAH